MASRIVDIATYLPANCDQFSGRTRYRADKDESSIAMGVAVTKTLLQAGDYANIDALLCFSGMPDFLYPKDVNMIQKQAGLSCPSYSIDTACASFVTSLKFAEALIQSGQHKRILMLQIMNWLNRGLEDLEDNSGLGDAATAVLIEGGDEVGIIGQKEVTDAEHFDFITMPEAHFSGTIEGFSFGKDSKHGRYLARGATQVGKDVLNSSDEKVTWLVPHHVNSKIVKIWAKAFNLAPEQLLHTFHLYGNVSAVNIPLSLHYYTKVEEKIKRGDNLLFFAPGAGMHTAAMLYRY